MESLLFTVPVLVVSILIVIWVSGALFLDVGRAFLLGGLLAVSWLLLASGALVFWHPLWKPFLTLLILTGVFLWWWFSQQPSNDRNWASGYSVLPRVNLKGDILTLKNVRNTEYRTPDDFTPRYETRSVRLSKLCGVDAVIAFWGSDRMCHPMFVFDFGSDGRICISIEVRYRVGQVYNFWRSLYRQQEIIYVVCDERDAILLRTKYRRGEDLYLYRLDVDALNVRCFFFEYASSINALCDRARWYHGLTSNCTTSIYGQGRGRLQWDWRVLFNGTLDRLMYERGFLNQQPPFETLKQRSWINEIANRAPEEGFGDFIRQELPGYQVRVGCDSQEFDMCEGRQA